MCVEVQQRSLHKYAYTITRVLPLARKAASKRQGDNHIPLNVSIVPTRTTDGS